MSLPLRSRVPPSAHLNPFQDKGYDVLGVLGREALADPQTWREGLEYMLRQLLPELGTGPLQALAVGHEPDDGWRPGVSDDPWVWPRGGVGSWALSSEALGEMLIRVKAIMDQGTHTQVPLWIGGVSRPEYLARLDLSQVHGVLVNPYHYRPGDWPSADWGLGDLSALLDQFQRVIAEQGVNDRCRLGIGELGISSYEVDPGFQAEWFARMLQMLDLRGDIDCAYVCCDSDLTLDGYGQFDTTERPKPSVAAIKPLAERWPNVGPTATTPDPEDDDEPEGEEPLAWTDQHFTVESIARCLATLAGYQAPRTVWSAIPEVWAAIGLWLTEYGLADSLEAKVALLAAMTIETDNTLLTVADPADYDWCERLLGYQSELGRALGNRYPGDGQRYRGRGLVLIRGRAQYTHYSALLGLPLLEEPDLALEPAVAAGLAVARFSDLLLFDAARQGRWATVLRGLDPALNRYDLFLRAVQVFWEAANGAAETDSEPPATLPAIFERAVSRIGDPYRWGGGEPGGFDAGGLAAWAYLTTAGLPLLPNHPDTLYEETVALSPEQARPGDLIFYAYEDASGLRYPHVGIVHGQPGLVLDARDGVGVGYHPHIQGAVRSYRRVRALVELQQEMDEAMWKEKYEALESRLYGRREATRALLKQCGPSEPPKIGDKKEVWVKFGVDLDQRYDRLYEWLDLLVERGGDDAESDEDHEEQAAAQQGQAEGSDGGQEDDQADASDAAGSDGDPGAIAVEGSRSSGASGDGPSDADSAG